LHSKIEILGEELILLAQKAILLPKINTLLISDLHLGKASHFQKKGINVPVTVFYQDLERLANIVTEHNVSHVIVLGDLFHAQENKEWDQFGDWLLKQPFKLTLVKGNHDILPYTCYEKYNIEVIDSYMVLGNLFLTHKPLPDPVEGKYILCGHIHPAVQLKGKAYEYVRAECFYFGKDQGYLPSFGTFTGNETLTIKKHDRVYAIAGKHVLEVPAL
jgi:DNA ligase-associated metallophosphoesterase